MKRILVAVALIAAFACSTHRVAPPAAITGIVTDDSGSPIPGVTVTLRGSGVPQTAVTLGAGHTVTALYELTPASNARGTIATIKLRYKEPKEETSKQITAAAVDDGKSAFDASSDMQFAAAIAEFGMLLRDSPYKGTASWEDVLQLARVARGEDLEGTREEFLRMLDSAKHVTGPRIAVK
jgi:uncharacterized protein DUF3520